MSDDRHSEADTVELITNPDEKAHREAENGVRQYRATLEIIIANIMPPNKDFRLKQAFILLLNQKALEGIHPLAGTYRNSRVTIGKSSHFPPPHLEVPDLVSEMCDYVNTNWNEKCDSSCGIRLMANELDSSLCRREWQDGKGSFLSGSEH
jgi:Fic family protein